MAIMTQELLEKYQNQINFTNADNMFQTLENIISQYGRAFILKVDHESEEDCVKSYIGRSAAIRNSCDVIEHYTKAILIKNGHTWNESKSLGHNLLELYKSLDDDCKEIIAQHLLAYNDYDLREEYSKINDMDKTSYETIFGQERDNTLLKLFSILMKYGLYDNTNYLKDYIIPKDNYNKGNYYKDIEDKSYSDFESKNEDANNLNIDSINYDYLMDNIDERKIIKKSYDHLNPETDKEELERLLTVKKDNLPEVKEESPVTVKFVPLEDGKTIEDELEKTKPSDRRGQHLGIKARFPGESLIEGNAEFLIAFAYTMNEISKKIRKEEVPKF